MEDNRREQRMNQNQRLYKREERTKETRRTQDQPGSRMQRVKRMTGTGSSLHIVRKDERS